MDIVNDTKNQEKEFIEKSKNGDVKAFENLVFMYQKKVYKSAYYLTGNNEDAYDVTQEVFLYAFKNIKKFREKSSFFTWLYWLIVDMSSRIFKKKASQKIISLQDNKNEDGKEIDIKDLSNVPQEVLEKKEKDQIILKAVNSLKDKYRIPVVLCDLENLSYKEASIIARCSESAIKTRLFRARRLLKKKLIIIYKS
jgi:RNA polymerase sigma-70 factor, ECF subfamily